MNWVKRNAILVFCFVFDVIFGFFFIFLGFLWVVWVMKVMCFFFGYFLLKLWLKAFSITAGKWGVVNICVPKKKIFYVQKLMIEVHRIPWVCVYGVCGGRRSSRYMPKFFFVCVVCLRTSWVCLCAYAKKAFFGDWWPWCVWLCY
jgi:hypothetical protein